MGSLGSWEILLGCLGSLCRLLLEHISLYHPLAGVPVGAWWLDRASMAGFPVAAGAHVGHEKPEAALGVSEGETLVLCGLPLLLLLDWSSLTALLPVPGWWPLTALRFRCQSGGSSQFCAAALAYSGLSLRHTCVSRVAGVRVPMDLVDQCLDGRSLLSLLAKIKCSICPYQFNVWGFPHSSIGKESSCNAGDPGSIPGSGRSAGEGIGYLLQYSWASLVAQLVKTLPATWETWVRSLDWEDPLEREIATHSSILAWRIQWTVQSMGSQRVGRD